MAQLLASTISASVFSLHNVGTQLKVSNLRGRKAGKIFAERANVTEEEKNSMLFKVIKNMLCLVITGPHDMHEGKDHCELPASFILLTPSATPLDSNAGRFATSSGGFLAG